MEDRRRSDHRYRERSPVYSSKYRDRSPDRYSDRYGDKYRSSRYRNRSRSHSKDRRADRNRSKSRSKSFKRSSSRGRHRSSRSRSPRHKYQSSKKTSSKSRHHRRSHSGSRSPSPLRPSRSNKDRDTCRPATKEELIAPPPPTISANHDSSTNDSEKFETYKSDSSSHVEHASEGPSGSSSFNMFSTKNENGENDAADAGEIIETDLNEEEKERIHREMEEKLRLALAKEGKIYPPPKPEASHPVFANDGSFLEIFKKMQEQMAQQQANALAEQRARNLPICKRRGGKILKTGVVAKSRASDSSNVDPKDFWSIYLQEVKKYKSASCDVDSQTRPLVK